jgi:hypothetical protein
MKTATLRAEAIPSIFQFPSWGTPAWEETYAKRTNVERGLFDFHIVVRRPQPERREGRWHFCG